MHQVALGTEDLRHTLATGESPRKVYWRESLIPTWIGMFKARLAVGKEAMQLLAHVGWRWILTLRLLRNLASYISIGQSAVVCDWYCLM